MQYGANPDLRDEDGKSPLDKARERNDEGHREVVAILQSPAEWITSSSDTVVVEGPDGEGEKKEGGVETTPDATPANEGASEAEGTAEAEKPSEGRHTAPKRGL